MCTGRPQSGGRASQRGGHVEMGTAEGEGTILTGHLSPRPAALRPVAAPNRTPSVPGKCPNFYRRRSFHLGGAEGAGFPLGFCLQRNVSLCVRLTHGTRAHPVPWLPSLLHLILVLNNPLGSDLSQQGRETRNDSAGRGAGIRSGWLGRDVCASHSPLHFPRGRLPSALHFPGKQHLLGSACKCHYYSTFSLTGLRERLLLPKVARKSAGDAGRFLRVM